MVERTFTVDGMTCEHCRAAVVEEVVAVAGITEVDLDLESGRLVVRGDRVDDEAVAAAVAEAGYSVGS